MIAEQQDRICEAGGDLKPALMAIDAGPIYAQRIMLSRIENELSVPA